jgi:hypothetical protein
VTYVAVGVCPVVALETAGAGHILREARGRGETITPVRFPTVTVRVDDFMP